MADDQWEYCELALERTSKIEGGVLKGKGGWGYECFVCYYGPNGCIYNQLSDGNRPMESNPFFNALGRLGAIGWEMVSIQHAVTAGQFSSRIDWNSRVAFFKRRVIAGRSVNEPKFTV